MEIGIILLQALMVLGLIAVGVHFKGLAIGLFGAVGVFLFVLIFQTAPGSVPVSAMLIIMTVVTATGSMQLAGGIDFLVNQAQKVIRKFPNQITYVAPLTTFAFCAGAGSLTLNQPYKGAYETVSFGQRLTPYQQLGSGAIQVEFLRECLMGPDELAALRRPGGHWPPANQQVLTRLARSLALAGHRLRGINFQCPKWVSGARLSDEYR